MFSYRILKDEYTRTNFQNVGKAQFPSLLKQLWANDPVGTKTNLIKSFMKAGIFPFKPNSIDRSRILNNKTNIDKNISSIATVTANNNQASRIQSESSTQPIINSFATSHEAIASLDRILEDTKSTCSDIEALNDRADNDDNEDEYLPSKLNFHTSKSTTSSNRQSKPQPDKTAVMKNDLPDLLPQEKKRKRKFSTIIGFDTSEEDGNILNFVTFLILLSIM